jgi:aldehyde dehydrogenase (NAD+)
MSDVFSPLADAYASGRTRPLAWRRSQLNALRLMLLDNRDAFVSAIMADLGKPAAETVLMELDLVKDEARFVRNRLGLWSARHPKPMHWLLQPAAGWTLAEPKGVVLIIAPWNYPVLLALEPLADALAAGNAVCIKPSELSPRTSGLLAELVPQYLDSAAIKVVEGGAGKTTELLQCPFNHIFYTGGGRVGKIVMKAAARNLTPVTLELGGKSPCFVDRTADINVAARRIVWGKFTNAGQTCVAPDYVLATPDIAQGLARRIAVAIEEFYGADPQASPDFGRIVNERHFERLCALLPAGTVPAEESSSPLVKAASAVGAAMDMVGRRLSAAVGSASASSAAATSSASSSSAAVSVSTSDTADGTAIPQAGAAVDPAGRIICGGKVDRSDRYIAPTVLYGTLPEAPVMAEEIFGPILPILIVEDAEAAINFINQRSRPLAAYVFSRDRDVRLAFERQTSSGALGYSIPLGHLVSSRLPFGGSGDSGIGAYHGKEGFKVFSHTKTVVSKPQFPDTFQFIYPPYNELTSKVIDLIAKLS